MASTPLFNKIWKILSWLGRAATVGATAGSLMILSLHNIHLFSSEKVGDNSNKISDTQGPVEINSPRTNTNTVTNNTWNIQVDNSNHYKVGEVINLNLRVLKVNQNSNSIIVRVDSPIQKDNKISNIQKQSLTTFDNLAVTQLFSAGNSLSFIPPQGNNYWNFPSSTNFDEGSGGLELNLLLKKMKQFMEIHLIHLYPPLFHNKFRSAQFIYACQFWGKPEFNRY